MLVHTSQFLIIILMAVLLPSSLSFPYSIYDMKNHRRAYRSGGSSGSSSGSSAISNTRQHGYDQSVYQSPSSSSKSSSSQYYGNYDALYDTGAADNYYVDDENDDRPEREYLYGKPTYHGEYKPTRYYYARAPSYNYYNDHAETTNPLDDLHEEMLQEDQNRQRNAPIGKSQWYQNTGQPKSLTTNFMKNLMLYNNGMNTDTQPLDVNDAMYDDEEITNPYFNDLPPQNEEPTDYFDPLKFQTHQFNRYELSPVNNQNYYNHEANRKGSNEPPMMSQKNRMPISYKDESHEDKEEKDLESLRKNHKSSWNNNDSDDNNDNGHDDDDDDDGDDNDDEMDNDNNNNNKYPFNDAFALDKSKHENAYNGGYDTGFDYDDDEWINWNRKRSLTKTQLRPLKALEYELTKALQQQQQQHQQYIGAAIEKVPATTKMTTTTMTMTPPPTTSTPSSNSMKVHEHIGQKEVVLSRPATPLRRHFSDNVLDALTKTTNEMKQSNQNNMAMPATKTDGQFQHTHSMGTKKRKRYVSNESTLAQQLNDLKQKQIKT